jgi:hypothetical protein
VKLSNVLLASLASLGVLTIGADSALAGLYFSAVYPGVELGYPLARTPASQASQGNNARANYTAQNRQVRHPHFATRISGSALKHKTASR